MSRTHSLQHASAIELLDADVRDEVRRHGVDPLTDAETVRRFARQAVRAHDQRSLSGAVRPVEDPDGTIEELVDRVAGFGPLQQFVDDPRLPFWLWATERRGAHREARIHRWRRASE